MPLDPVAQKVMDKIAGKPEPRTNGQTYIDTLLERKPAYSYGEVLPFNMDPQGNTNLDMTAGLPGQLLAGWNTWEKMLKGQVAPYAIKDGPDGSSTVVINPEIAQSAGALSMAVPVGSLGGTAPKGATRMFLGRNSAGADGLALRQAEQMAEAGLSKERIYSQTGWFQGEDGHWRYEISDHKAKVISDKVEYPEPDASGSPIGNASAYNTGSVGVPLFDKSVVSDFLKHQDLQRKAVYPEGTQTAPIMNSTEIVPSYQPFIRGYFDPEKNRIGMAKASPKDFRDTLLHELQHAIQKKEGFSGGANTAQFLPENFADTKTAFFKKANDTTIPEAERKAAWDEFMRYQLMGNNAYKQYRNNLGEREARNVSKRADMTGEQRRQIPPWKTMDPIEELK